MIAYAVEKLYLAVRGLTGSGTLTERMDFVWSRHLIHIRQEDLPENLWTDYMKLKKAVTSTAPANDEGRICASIRTMNKKALVALAEGIVDLYSDALAELSKGEPGE